MYWRGEYSHTHPTVYNTKQYLSSQGFLYAQLSTVTFFTVLKESCWCSHAYISFSISLYIYARPSSCLPPMARRMTHKIYKRVVQHPSGSRNVVYTLCFLSPFYPPMYTCYLDLMWKFLFCFLTSDNCAIIYCKRFFSPLVFFSHMLMKAYRI